MKKKTNLHTMTLGQRIRETRVAKGLTVIELSKITEFTQSQICHYEDDTNQPSAKALITLSNALEISLDFLMKGELLEKTDILEGLPEPARSKVIEYASMLKYHHLKAVGKER